MASEQASSEGRAGTSARISGVLVTYQRAGDLRRSLERLAEQERSLDLLILVDNAPTPESEASVAWYRAQGLSLDYLPQECNIGNAGAYTLGIDQILTDAGDDDWIVLLDDDDPPGDHAEPEPTRVFLRLVAFAETMRALDPHLAAVGFGGTRFDWKRGRSVRVPDEDLAGPVKVDYIGNNHFPFYLVAAVRAVGTWDRSIFFGFGELEYGLRFRSEGWSLYADGTTWRQLRATLGRLGHEARPSAELNKLTWRRYYTMRNLVYILRRHGRSTTAVRVALARGLVKPLVNLPRHPGEALDHLRLNWMACHDGWTATMGRRGDPASTPTADELRGRDRSGQEAGV
jgi:GT2 family glycosyltransferase